MIFDVFNSFQVGKHLMKSRSVMIIMQQEKNVNNVSINILLPAIQ